eukprot:CAMPEP_0181448226 /NCGR_PEP_ID=MMETSP1110-20121109/27030_1 /TAXON_ID=174948 /ORGANISM="Symbiodinium sp., Strain CCMP421" /LENGTH=190 /DNA_ID=CAMNT_0023572367 /DNA_START=21 /DNA_END=593 /DNA_ORIENTATION=+
MARTARAVGAMPRALWLLPWLALPWLFVGPGRMGRPVRPSGSDSLRRAAPAGVGPPGAQQTKARFMGKWVDWKPMLKVASKVEEVGGDMPLGIRITQRESDGAFEITEIISGGAAAVGTLDVQEGNIIHAVSCEVGGRKDVTTAKEVNTVDQITQAILSNSDEVVMMLVEKPDEGAAGSISFLTNVASRL